MRHAEPCVVWMRWCDTSCIYADASCYGFTVHNPQPQPDDTSSYVQWIAA